MASTPNQGDIPPEISDSTAPSNVEVVRFRNQELPKQMSVYDANKATTTTTTATSEAALIKNRNALENGVLEG